MVDLSKIKLKTFPNPMRDDGVFVGEDKEIQPYGTRLDGTPAYPAVPDSSIKHNFPIQMDKDFAERLVLCWNSCCGMDNDLLRIAASLTHPE